MCRSKAGRMPFTAAALVLALAGCGGTPGDKAGGTKHARPTVLTMANSNGDTWELEPFTAAAARLSQGTLRIEFKNDWRLGKPDYEARLIGDVKAGTADLGWAGSRAFDSVGAPSFDALHAPLLIDNFPLERRVLESSLVGTMLDGLKPLGIVGLGVLPGPMRKPLGVSPLVRPGDYAGKTLAIQRSEVAGQALRALGARGAAIPAGGKIDGYDGIEAQASSMDGNEYDKVGKYLTANVNLWPRPMVLFMNLKAFDALSGPQRTALLGAARAALPATLKVEQQGNDDATANLCRRGVKFLTAGDDDLAAMHEAVQPVYDRLERDHATRTAIEQIKALRTGTAATADAPTCSKPSAPATATGHRTPIDGRYRIHTTAADLRAAGAPESDINPSNYGTYEVVLDRGRFRIGTPRNPAAVGTCTVVGHTLTMTVVHGGRGRARNKPGERWDYRWSRYRDQLTLGPVNGGVSPQPLLAAPWRRIGNAP
jgi:TRAP-type C4-dicarboxylate transport system substrate-binding protein